MRLAHLLNRPPPQMWSGSGLPWYDPEFSTRMLQEHLSQEHDLASRRALLMDRYAAWLHEQVLQSRPGRILDLGCGPGLLTGRLARRGHTCHGIDFAPAAVNYAITEAIDQGLECRYRLEDVRTADFGTGFDLITFIFGDLDTMPEAEAAAVVARAISALTPTGNLVLEVHTPAAVERAGNTPPSWSVQERGLFSSAPHLLLTDAAWYPDQGSASRFTVVELDTAQPTEYVVTTRALDDTGYDELVGAAGGRVEARFGDLSGRDRHPDDDFVVTVVSGPA